MNRHLAPALISASALGLLLLQPVITMADPPAHARNENSAKYRGYSGTDSRHDDGRGGYGREYDDRRDDRWDHRDHDRHDYDRRDDRRDYDRRDRDAQHYYPRRGYVVHRLPPGPRVVHHHGHRYYYSRGAWYRPHGPSYVVVDPPIGLVVSFLPEIHATTYFGGVPYYRAGPVYYVWNPRARGYVVTDRPYRGW